MVSPLLSLLLLASAAQTASPLEAPGDLFKIVPVNHRRSQSSVKHQGQRGTCAAFSICGALETFPGVPTDLCEQLLYATVKLHEQDIDGWIRTLGGPLALKEGNALREYVPLFEIVGTCHESLWPYDPRAAVAGPDVPEEIRHFLEFTRIGTEQLRGLRQAVGKWGFSAADAEVLDEAGTRDVARLQALLRSGHLGIPVGYVVHSGAWSTLSHEPDVTMSAAEAVLPPDLLEQFAERPRPEEASTPQQAPTWLDYEAAHRQCRDAGLDLVHEVRERRWATAARFPQDEYGGHAVLIVGFDERGFLIKNSWGTDWGDGGYCTIAYDYHRLYAQTALVLRAARLRNPELSPFETTARIRDGAMRLKVQPVPTALGEGLSISTWMEDARDAAFEVVEYTLEARGAGSTATWSADTWSTVASHAALAGATDARTGAPWTLSPLLMTRLGAATELRITARYGVDVLDTEQPREARFVAERRFESFPVALTAAVDLQPRNVAKSGD